MDINVLHNLSYGMYIVSSFKGDLMNAQIANTVFQITSSPAMIAVSISKKNLTHEYIKKSRLLSISVLAQETSLKLIGNFGFKSGRKENKFKDIKYEKLSSGCPVVLDSTICYAEAKVINEIDCVTHTVFLTEMTGSKMLRPGKPMTYEFYHQVKRGATPENAPTFIKGESEKKEISGQKYICTVCNYIYDPKLGDPDAGIAPGTAFKDIPEDWVCPVCGADKSKFVKQE